eukprot:scaffold23406_cov84-Amphora_coffeaeformis.AAC.1
MHPSCRCFVELLFWFRFHRHGYGGLTTYAGLFGDRVDVSTITTTVARPHERSDDTHQQDE